MSSYRICVNGASRTCAVEGDTPLLCVLRDHLGLTGTKYGCGIARCGACTVLQDGVAIRSCVTPISQVTGAITTIEGLPRNGTLHPVQQAWLDRNVPQCGYCQPGQIDFIVEVAEICAKLGGRAVKLIWTREDDFEHDRLRPCAVSWVEATTDGRAIRSWRHRLACESPAIALAGEFVATFPIVGAVVSTFRPSWRSSARRRFDSLDPAIAEGIKDTVYTMRPDVHHVSPRVPGSPRVGYWRSVGYFHSIFAVESAMDELAHNAGIDPVTFRLANLEGGDEEQRRMRECVTDVAGMAGRDDLARPGTGFGMACFSGWGSYAALAVSVAVDGRSAPSGIRVLRAWAAVDAGFTVSPDIVRQQVEGGIIFGLSGALTQKITIANGVVRERNFHACDLLRMHECPSIEVKLRTWAPGAQPPTGVGELMVPLPAPAVANAVHNLTGERLRCLPLTIGART